MESIEYNVARALLDIKAVQLRPHEPFTWASGWKSPIYCDNRKILSYPEVRKTIADYLVHTVEEYFKDVDVIAGVATGAIALGIMVAERMNKPFVYVRPKAKNHGMCAQVEGYLPENSRVVVIEDLISTGGSSLSAVEALSKAGAEVLGMVAIFSYNFAKARKGCEDANVVLYTLSNYDALVEEAVKCNYISEDVVEVLKEWRFRPDTWGQE